MEDGRQIGALRRGEPAAAAELWRSWSGALWSVCRAMAAAYPESWALYGAVARGVRAAAREWSPGLPLRLQLAAWLHGLLTERLALRPLAAALPWAPPRAKAGAPLEALAQLPAEIRLIFLLELLFDCPPDALAPALNGAASEVLAASSAAWAWMGDAPEAGDEAEGPRLALRAALSFPGPPLAEPARGGAPPVPALRRSLAGLLAVALALLLGGQLGALSERAHSRALEDAARSVGALAGEPARLLRTSDPDALARALVQAGVAPSQARVLNLEGLGFGLLGGAVRAAPGGGSEALYSGDGALLAIALVSDQPPLGRPAVARWAAGRLLLAYPVGTSTVVVCRDPVLGLTRVVSGALPPEQLLALVSRMLEVSRRRPRSP